MCLGGELNIYMYIVHGTSHHDRYSCQIISLPMHITCKCIISLHVLCLYWETDVKRTHAYKQAVSKSRRIAVQIMSFIAKRYISIFEKITIAAWLSGCKWCLLQFVIKDCIHAPVTVGYRRLPKNIFGA